MLLFPGANEFKVTDWCKEHGKTWLVLKFDMVDKLSGLDHHLISISYKHILLELPTHVNNSAFNVKSSGF